MAITIDDDQMTLEIDGTVIAVARRRPGGWWEVTYWPRFFDRNQAITALTVTELLDTGYSGDDPAAFSPVPHNPGRVKLSAATPTRSAGGVYQRSELRWLDDRPARSAPLPRNRWHQRCGTDR